jgi:5-methylcytosine-specific restriction endonuclease McrA
MSPTRLCHEPRCASPATYRGRCAQHSRQRERQTHGNKGIYATAKWRHTRKRVLFLTPLCAKCGAIATDVHHRIDISDGGDLWALDNLEALCHPCHSKITRRAQ